MELEIWQFWLILICARIRHLAFSQGQLVAYYVIFACVKCPEKLQHFRNSLLKTMLYYNCVLRARDTHINLGHIEKCMRVITTRENYVIKKQKSATETLSTLRCHVSARNFTSYYARTTTVAVKTRRRVLLLKGVTCSGLFGIEETPLRFNSF